MLEKARIPSLYTLKAKAHAMARTCDTDERWPHSKRFFIWRTGDREKSNRTIPSTLQGRMRDLQTLGINSDSWEVTATDRDAWRHTAKLGLLQYEETQRVKWRERLLKTTVCVANRPTTAFTCSKCGRDCHSRIGLHSHNSCCTTGANLWSFETDRCQ